MCDKPPLKIKHKVKATASNKMIISALNYNRSSKQQKRSTDNWFEMQPKKYLKIPFQASKLCVTPYGNTKLMKRLMGNIVVNEYGVMNLTELKDKFKAKCLPHSGLTG